MGGTALRPARAAAVTHGVFSGGRDALDGAPIEKLFCTDTIEARPEPSPGCANCVSVASLFAEAIRRIDRRESISSLFDD